MKKKYARVVQVPLTEAEYAQLKAEAKRHGYSQQDYRRMLLLGDRSLLAVARQESYWEEDTLENIWADVRKLLRRQLHYGGISDGSALQILRRLEALQISRQEASRGERNRKQNRLWQ